MEKSFRVIINLSYYFHDHRSTAMMFINDNINSIEDLEKKVCDIFNIENFYFTCQNRFLPSCEDVRILQKDDLLWVIPKVKESIIPVYVPENVPIVEELEKSSKKRKKKHKEEAVEELMEEQEKIPKKKKKKSELAKISEEEDVTEEVVEKKKKNKHKHKEPVFEDIIEEQEIVEEKIAKPKKLNSLHSSFINHEPGTEYQCKGDFPYYRKRVTLPTITDEYLKNKKINIVKIEYIHNGEIVKSEGSKMEVDQIEKSPIGEKAKNSILTDEIKETSPISNELEISNINNNVVEESKSSPIKSLNVSSLLTPIHNKSTLLDSKETEMEITTANGSNAVQFSEELSKNTLNETVFESEMDYSMTSGISEISKPQNFSKKSLSGVGRLLEALKSSDFDESLNGEGNEEGDHITKRKRIRKRKKRTDTPVVSKLPVSSKVSNLKPFVFPGKPKTHIMFNDSENSGTSPLFTDVIRNGDYGSPSSSLPSSIEPVGKSEPEIPTTPEEESIVIENITIDDSMEMENSWKFNKELMLNEDELMKQPSMTGLLPRKDDVIAFKIIKVGENYSPVITKFVAGKVINFSPELKEVEFEILHGLEEFAECKGKFSLEDEEEEIKNTKKLLWGKVFYPKLLYP